MMNFLSRYEGPAYALMRIVTGFLFLCHGSQKLFGFPAAAREGAPAWIQYGAGGIEFFGGLLVMIGLATPPGGVPVQRLHGGGLLTGPRHPGAVSAQQRRRVGGAVLLRVPVHRLPRRGTVGRGPRLTASRRPPGARADGSGLSPGSGRS